MRNYGFLSVSDILALVKIKALGHPGVFMSREEEATYSTSESARETGVRIAELAGPLMAKLQRIGTAQDAATILAALPSSSSIYAETLALQKRLKNS